MRLAIGGLMSRGLVEQQGVPGETRVPLAALGVEDPERRPAPRRTVPVVRDEGFGALADDVTTQADPRPAGQLEPDAGRLGHRSRQAATQSRRIEDQQQGLGTPGERGQPMEPVADPCRRVGPGQSTAWQVEDEQVDRATGQERAGDAQALVQAGRGDDDEPLEVDAPGDRLHRVEAARQVEPGHDRAGGLRLGGDPQPERGPAARAVAADRDAGGLREPARPEDRVERGEARADDAIVRTRVETRVGLRLVERDEGRGGRQGQRSDHHRSCGTPAGPKARDSGVHITPTGRHETAILEQMF